MTLEAGSGQVKSKQRVSDHGEVFTSEREVNAMLDLVKRETENIESRFLEPACGTGNFLVEVLRRKLNIVDSRFKKDQHSFEKNAVYALSSIYGVELLKDNVTECRRRLLKIALNYYDVHFFSTAKVEFRYTIEFLLSKNIIQGDALTLMDIQGKKPIVFSEWSFMENRIKRKDFTMIDLFASQPIDGPNLFSDLGDQAFIPTPVAEFPFIDFLKISEYA